jgi:hypothetical protein
LDRLPLGWYSTVGCPRGAAEENKYKKGASGPPKTIKKKKSFFVSFLEVINSSAGELEIPLDR